MAELVSRSSLCSLRHHRDTAECCGAPMFPRGFRVGRFAVRFQLRFCPVAMSRPPGLRSSVSRSRSGIFGDGVAHKQRECVPRRRISRNYSSNVQIKKFKDALAEHTPDRCSLGPTKGLEEKELQALAGNKYLSFNYTPKPVPATEQEEAVAKPVVSPGHSDLPLPVSLLLPSSTSSDQKPLVNTAR